MTTQLAHINTRALYARQDRITLQDTIGHGREGSVHSLQDRPSLAAKLISSQNPDPADTARKLELMVLHPPPDPRTRHYQITWPLSLVTTPKRRGRTVGYTMTLLNPSVYHHIGSYFNPARRRSLLPECPRGYTYLHLLTMARNLAKATAHLHAHDTVIGDINSKNVLANDHGRIAVIDTDSFQVEDPDSGQRYRCRVGTPEYTPPRLQGLEFSSLDRTRQDDLFSLAVMIYQLTLQGAHPFAGTQAAAGPDVGNIAQRIAISAFAHSNCPQAAPPHSALICRIVQVGEGESRQ